MSESKTRPHDASVEEFVEAIPEDRKREDSRRLVDLMRSVTGEDPRMWGPSIVGFGSYHYRYESGREGDWLLTGFSPRKRALTLYIMSGFSRYAEILKRLGKHTTGKSCLYVRRLDDIDLEVLEELVRASVDHLRTEVDRSS